MKKPNPFTTKRKQARNKSLEKRMRSLEMERTADGVHYEPHWMPSGVPHQIERDAVWKQMRALEEKVKMGLAGKVATSE